MGNTVRSIVTVYGDADEVAAVIAICKAHPWGRDPEDAALAAVPTVVGDVAVDEDEGT